MSVTDRRAAIALISIAVPAAAIAVFALSTAAGPMYANGRIYRVEFVNQGLWNMAAVLAVPVFFAAWSNRRLAPVALLLAAVPQFMVAQLVVDRHRGSGHGDGLEVLHFLPPILGALLFVLAAALGAVLPSRYLHPVMAPGARRAPGG